MRSLTTILLSISLTVTGQQIERVFDHSTIVHGPNFKGVIFSSHYHLPILDDNDRGRFTPTKDEVLKFERELKGRIKEINKGRRNQGKHYGPVIDRRLRKYTRQYVGFINDQGQRILHVGFNWKRDDKVEMEDYVLALDGGSYHWTIRYNLDMDEFFQFGINGISAIPNSCQQNVYAMVCSLHVCNGVLLN